MESSEEFFIGLRVIRGKRWTSDKKPGPGPGSAGTIINYTKRDSGTEVHVEVKWDTGVISNIKHPGRNSLLVLNTASIGITHLLSCGVCETSPILGFCWQCMDCSDMYLCSGCYHANKHSLKHTFERYDETYFSTGVGKRKDTKRIQLFGLYKRATVLRRNNNGTKDKKVTKGKVKSTNSDDSHTAYIKWESGKMDVHKLGAEGNTTDLTCIKGASGGFCYIDHLPEPWELEIILEDTGYVSICSIHPSEKQPKTEQLRPKPRCVDTSSIIIFGSSNSASLCENVNSMVDTQNDKVNQVTTKPLTVNPPCAGEDEEDYLYPCDIESVMAIMDFLPVSKDEIGFFKGDIIVGVFQKDEEWLIGTVDGKTGYFPSDYVKLPNKPCRNPTAGIRRVDKIGCGLSNSQRR